MLEFGFADFLYRGLTLSFKAQCLPQIERGGGECVWLGVMVLHRHRAIFRFAFGIAYLNSRGVGLFLMLFLMCFCTVMQFVCTVCMQAITHSVDNVPTQHAVKPVVVGLGFVEHCCLRLFLGDQLQ